MTRSTMMFMMMWLFLADSAIAAEAPRLADEQTLFAADDTAWIQANRRWPQMRLSPTGKFLLYARPAGEETVTLALRDTATREDTTVVPRMDPQLASVAVRFEPFNAAGTSLALMDPINQGHRLVLFDIAERKLIPTGATGPYALGRFVHGDRLIVYTGALSWVPKAIDDKLEPIGNDVLDPRSFVNSSNPRDDLLCIFMVHRGAPGERPRQGLAIYDVGQNAITAELPVHPRHGGLDDIETKWTSDGRYLYYPDGVGDSPQSVVRVWDQEQGKVTAVVAGGYPLGPGPTDSTMVIQAGRHGGYGILLHNAATDATWTLADASARAETAAGGYVVYRRLTDNGETVHIAKITMPATDY